MARDVARGKEGEKKPIRVRGTDEPNGPRGDLRFGMDVSKKRSRIGVGPAIDTEILNSERNLSRRFLHY
jgi:hypothetical protein